MVYQNGSQKIFMILQLENVLYPVQNIKLLSPNIKNDSKGLHVFLMVVTIFTKIL